MFYYSFKIATFQLNLQNFFILLSSLSKLSSYVAFQVDREKTIYFGFILINLANYNILAGMRIGQTHLL